MAERWMTTGGAMSAPGGSRQHVLALGERGDLSCPLIGDRRQIRLEHAQVLTGPALTREQEKSLWLHRAVLGSLMADPGAVIGQARRNIDSWSARHRADGMTVRSLDRWRDVLNSGVDRVIGVLTSPDEDSIELRQNSPFAGVLSDTERRRILRSFRVHWDEEHVAA